MLEDFGPENIKGKEMSVKLFYCDLETGGVDKKKHPVLQIAGAIEIDGKIERRFEWKVKPFEWQELDQEALDVCGFTPEMIETFDHPSKVFMYLKQMLNDYVDFWDPKDKFHFVGYNAKFDDDFLREFFKNNATTAKEVKFGNGYGNFFWVPPLDVMNLAALATFKNRGELALPKFKLAPVTEFFGLKPDGKFHDAQADIDITIRLFKLLMGEGNV